MRNYAKKLCREAVGKANTKDLRALASAKTIGAVQTLAQAHRQVATTIDVWDADPCTPIASTRCWSAFGDSASSQVWVLT